MSNDDPTQQFPPSAHQDDGPLPPGPWDSEPPERERRWPKRVLKTLVGVAAGAVLLTIGVAAGGGPAERIEVPGPERTVEVEVIKEVEVPGPERTVEVEVEVPGPERTVEVEVPGPTETVEVEVPGPEVEVVPPICVESLDQAELIVHSVADMLMTGDFNDAANVQLAADIDDYNMLSLSCRILAEQGN